jgi:hypothetical protein
VRFLQTQWRSPEIATDSGFEPVDELTIGTSRWLAWHEAVEQDIVLTGLSVADVRRGVDHKIAIAAATEVEELVDDSGRVAGRLVRTRDPLAGRVTISSVASDGEVDVVRVAVENTAALGLVSGVSRTEQRDLVSRRSFVGAHVMLTASDGDFASVIDPPPWAVVAAAQCTNARCWPVLAGERADDEQVSDIVLGSPIILGDYPAIAEQSPGQLYDSAEIDEILTLRVMTMTDEEKAAARATDDRAAAIIDRSDDMPPEIFERLHGVLHDLGASPETDEISIAGRPVARGSRVLLKPRRGADAQDMFLTGQVGIVRRIDTDAEGRRHVAILLEDDPGNDVNEWYGRFYYFAADEVVPV